MWVILGVFSAISLGAYDVVRKHVLKGNDVMFVLFFVSITAAIIFLPLIFFSTIGVIEQGSVVYVRRAGLHLHFLMFLKAFLVSTSWVLAYSALRNLPMTIMVPIRSTSPMWTLLGAMLIFSERFTGLQWTGMAVVMTFFYLLSLAGKKEGIVFIYNRWVLCAVGAAMLGGASTLYDKYLFRIYDSLTIQAWYSIYMVPVFALFLSLGRIWQKKQDVHFHWSFLIPVIAIILIISDVLYFRAVSQEGSLITILSVVRRSSVIISFISGAVIFKEGNLKRKAFALAGIFTGVIIIVLGTL